MESDRRKSSAKETLTDLVLEFLEAAVHEFLFARQVYPNEAFVKRVLYDVPVHMSRHPLLCEYIHSMLSGCRSWIFEGELEKLCVLLLSKEGRTVKTLVIEPGWSQAFAEAEHSEEQLPLPLIQLEEAFRSAMVALVAAPMTTGMQQKEPTRAHTFRILAHTVEDASTHRTAVDGDNTSNSWVLADPFWCETQTQQGEIFPLKAIQGDGSPIKINMYMEQQSGTPL